MSKADVEALKKVLFQAWMTDNPKNFGEAMDNAANKIAEHLASRRLIGRVPDGWKLVPIEPTEEMLSSGDNQMPQFSGNETGYDVAKDVYWAMVFAAPDDGGE